MLATEIFERSSHVVFGYEHDRSLNGVRKRLQDAPKFILDPNAVTMAAGVALSKPSSILTALPFTRLPADPMWIEFANADAKEAMARLGSPNTQLPRGVTVIERSGFLLRYDKEGDILIEYVHRDRTPSGDVLMDVAPIVGKLKIKDFDEVRHSLISALASVFRENAAPEKIAKGRVQEHLNKIHNDPHEADADLELDQRLSWISHVDLIGFKEILLRKLGSDQVAQIERDQGSELIRLFKLMILPTLILLNCRNAVDIEKVEAPEKLNKQRIKKGRPPIVEHSVVKVHLSETRRKVYASHGHNASIARGALVIGHFKVRRGGRIFWWSPHWRGSPSSADMKTYIVTS